MGPIAPLPTLILSTERIGVISLCPGKECSVCDVEHLPRNHLLDNRNAEVARNLQHGVAADARKNASFKKPSGQALALNPYIVEILCLCFRLSQWNYSHFGSYSKY